MRAAFGDTFGTAGGITTAWDEPADLTDETLLDHVAGLDEFADLDLAGLDGRGLGRCGDARGGEDGRGGENGGEELHFDNWGVDVKRLSGIFFLES